MEQRFFLISALLCTMITGAWADRTSGYDGTTLPDAPDMSGTVVNVNAENAQYTLDGAYGNIDGKTINFTESMDVSLVIGRPNKFEGSNTTYRLGSFTADAISYEELIAKETTATPYYQRAMKNVTFTANEGVTLKGFVGQGGGHATGPGTDLVLDKTVTSGEMYYSAANWENITFKGLTLTSRTNIDTSVSETKIEGVTFDGCSFDLGDTESSDAQAIRIYSEQNASCLSGLTVTNCSFSNCFQGVYAYYVKNITVENSTFDTTGHNAIAVQSGSYGAVDCGDVVITGNTFKNIGNRIIRFGNIAGTSITITDNTAENSGKSGEVIKAESLADGITYNIRDNNWGEGTSVGNEQFEDSYYDLTVYPGSATTQTVKTKAEWMAILEVAPNAIAIADGTKAENVALAESTKNVVLEYASYGSVKSYVCPNFILTDKEDFYSPVDFTAVTGSYSRENTAGFNSVCLPFDLTTEMVNDGKIETFSTYLESTNKLYFTEQESVEAGLPCIVKCEDDDEGWDITLADAQIKATPISSICMKGSFVNEVIGAGHYKLNAEGTRFGITKSDEATCTAFRSYLDLDIEDEFGTDGAKTIDVIWDANQDDIDAISSTSMYKTETESIYSVNGAQLNGMQKGINIVKMSDGSVKKVIKK